MDLDALQSQLDSFDPTQIGDPVLRAQFSFLCDAVAMLLAEVRRLTEEDAPLRRKHGAARGGGGGGGGDAAPPGAGGGSGQRGVVRVRPKSAPPLPPVAGKQKPLQLEQIVRVDRAQLVGPGWRRHGCVRQVVQDLLILPITWVFHRERWYSPILGKTLVAALPAGYDQGRYGPDVKALALQMGHECRVPQIPLLRFLQQSGMGTSKGTLGEWLSGKSLLAPFHEEAAQVFAAGMRTAEWVGHDVTSTKVNGVSWSCHGLGNDRFSSFHTLPGQDRASTLRAFQGGKPLVYRLDAVSDAELIYLRVSQRVRRLLDELGREQTWEEAEFTSLLQTHLPDLSEATLKKVRDAAALAGFRHRSDCATPPVTLKDDASASSGITPEEGLCWWHESRHFEELPLGQEEHQRLRDRFLRTYWRLYRQIMHYRQNPTPERERLLAGRFDRLFAWKPQCFLLRHRMALTFQKRERMLTVLRYPSVPLHNNGMEQALRPRARRRDISYQTRSEDGVKAWDTMQGLIQTAQKQGIHFRDYLRDRLRNAGEVPRLADLIGVKTGVPAKAILAPPDG